MRKNFTISTGIACALILLLLAWEKLPPPPPTQFIGGSIIGLNKKAPAHWPNLSISNVLLDIRKNSFTEGVFKCWNCSGCQRFKSCGVVALGDMVQPWQCWESSQTQS